MRKHFYEIMPSKVYQKRIHIISTYANDIHKALWYDEVCMYKNAKCI